MGWQKSILQKDIIYYFKYWELWGIFTKNDHISDNSIQINIEFTFTVCISCMSLVETAYPTVNFIQVINKEVRAT